jgi:hypothetical protein
MSSLNRNQVRVDVRRVANAIKAGRGQPVNTEYMPAAYYTVPATHPVTRTKRSLTAIFHELPAKKRVCPDAPRIRRHVHHEIERLDRPDFDAVADTPAAPVTPERPARPLVCPWAPLRARRTLHF